MLDATGRLIRRLTTSNDPACDAGASRTAAGLFDGADLSVEGVRRLMAVDSLSPTWWDATTGEARFPDANLRGCNLRSARLGALACDRIDFSSADLANADLAGAQLGGGTFDSALLEDANLGGAHLRFASFRKTVLEGARLRAADLRGAVLSGAQMDHADFREAELEEADLRDVRGREVDFGGARLVLADLRGADLQGADFRGAVVRGAKFDAADFRHAHLEHVNLTSCSIEGIRLSDALLDRTKLHRSQLGPAIGEELSRDYELARRAYLNLEVNFLDIGDPEAASWAYRRRRRVQKLDARRQVRVAVQSRAWTAARAPLSRYASDKLVEVVCDYGESVPRVLLTLLLVFAGFMLWYGVTGAVAVDVPGSASARQVTSDPVALLQYTLTAMLAPGSAPERLHASGRIQEVVALLQSFVSIFLIGLLGFVAGNRIRR